MSKSTAVHQLLTNHPQDGLCSYCNLSIQKWESRFTGSQHYKSGVCSNCEHTTWRKMQFIGSGHDSWNKGDWKEKINHTYRTSDKTGELSSGLEHLAKSNEGISIVSSQIMREIDRAPEKKKEGKKESLFSILSSLWRP